MRQQSKRTNGVSRIARGLIAVIVGLVLAVQPQCAVAQSQIVPAATGRFVDQVFRDETGEHKYVVFLPVGHRVDKPAPAILFLHGAGERGIENRMQLTLGLAPFVKARAKSFPFVVVFPQCESTDGRILESWQIGSTDGRRALAILDHATKQFGIDPGRIARWLRGRLDVRGARPVATLAIDAFRQDDGIHRRGVLGVGTGGGHGRIAVVAGHTGKADFAAEPGVVRAIIARIHRP